ncbi:RRXRR protein [Thermodesulfitimonas autotrophica]|uniref:RRXRR protein n=1 Tax=Thermodesulfitimonas autotrophica TaxID=1894989 RepID=A0A3N5AX04_9THEO|nr:RRXRR domain-containing protein [Thermodesulfitimonas autotrophica]RPF49549.1 RRXRR protein [Thermodesulfitimonas autotrophica]
MVTRVPVVGVDGRPLMPTTPRKARLMIRDGIAVPRRNKLGLFYVQMLRPVGTKTQPVALAVDPGAKYDGVAVASHRRVELKAMVFLPDDVPKKMDARRNLRRARRYRNTPRRPKRFDNRRRKGYWLAPTQRSKVETRLKVVRELCKIYPIRLIVTEDVRFNHARDRNGKYFSTVEIGKTLTYREYRKLAELKLVEVSETDAWRARFGLEKRTDRKWEQVPETHANDAVAMLMGVTGCHDNRDAPFWVWHRLRYARRSLHRQHFQKGGIRPKFGGTTNGGLFRKGDWVEAEKAGKVYRGWVCGLPTETTKLVGVADADGRRIGQFSMRKIRLLARSTGFSWREVKPAFLP